MANDINDFIDNNYSDYASIIKEELFTDTNPPVGFIESIILILLPALRKIKNSEELRPLLKIQLLNIYNENELPSNEKIKLLSDKIFNHYTKDNKDSKSEVLNEIHSKVGLFLLIIMTIVFIGSGFLVFAFYPIVLVIWFLPALSGYLAFRKSKFTYFGTEHFLWMILNIGLIFLLIIYLFNNLVHIEPFTRESLPIM